MSSLWAQRRSATDVKLSGLCGGLAARWGVDPTLVRVGCAVLALSGGIGVVLYLAGWFLLPVAGRTRAPVDDLLGEQARRWPREAWVAVVVFACIAVFSVFGSLTPFGFGPAVILALIWYFGYYRTRSGQPSTPVSADRAQVTTRSAEPGVPVTPFTQAAEAWRVRMAEHAQAEASGRPEGFGQIEEYQTGEYAQTDGSARTGDYIQSEHGGKATGPAPRRSSRPSVTTWPLSPTPQGATAWDGIPTDVAQAFWAHPDPAGLFTEPEPPTPTPSRRSSLAARRLRLAGITTLGVVLAGLGVMDLVGVAVPVVMYLAAAVLVVGLTLVVATWWGRARGILPVGILLGLALVAATAVAPAITERNFGSEQLVYASPTALPTDGDMLDLGRLEVDLRALPVRRDLTYRAQVDLGSLEVTVPSDTAVRIVYHVASGVVSADGVELASGNGLDSVVEPPGGPPGTPVLTLDLEVGRGQIVVNR